MASDGGSDVHLAIYDLSNGMARSLSRQFLGVAIDVVPHTSLLVFGREYYYGGGVQSADPSAFRSSTGMRPVRTEALGRTAVSRGAFDAWCLSVSSDEFHAGSYDLLRRNCNHFSHEAAVRGLRLARGVPEWVLDVPRRFLSSPMGQVIRPMLEEMQVTRPPAAGASSFPVPPPAAMQRPPQAHANPWAGSAAAEPSGASGSDGRRAGVDAAAAPPSRPPPAPSVLDRYRAPMLSQDRSTLGLCIKKLLPTLLAASGGVDAAMEGTGWEALFDRLKGTTVDAAAPADCDTEATTALAESSVHELWQLLSDDDAADGGSSHGSSVILYVLLVLRLVVLDPNSRISLVPRSAYECMASRMERPGGGGWKTPSARSLAWCVLSNAATRDATATAAGAPSDADDAAISADTTVQQRLLDAALSDLSPPDRQSAGKAEVRQAASAYLYNVVLRRQQQRRMQYQRQHPRGDQTTAPIGLLDDDSVSILCANLDGSLTGEPDSTTRLRRLLAVGRILVPISDGGGSSSSDENGSNNVVAINLAHDLGLEGTLQELVAGGEGTGHLAVADATECRALAAELLALFERY